MEVKQRGARGIIRRYAGLVILFSCVIAVHAQTLQPIIDDAHPIVGRAISIRVPLAQIDTASVSWQLPVLPTGLAYAQSPVLRSNLAGGPFQRAQRGQAEFLISLIAQKSTRYVLPEFQIADNVNRYTIAPIILEVYENSNTDTVPISIQWSGKQELYTGESSLYVLYIMYSDAFVFPESISFGSSRSGQIDEVFGAGTVITDEINGKEWFTIPIVSVLFTPAQQGTSLLPQVEVTMNGKTTRSEAFSITVEGLPVQLQVNAAIGDMTFTHSLSERDVAFGQQVVLTLGIEGKGNIPYVTLPSPSVAGLIETNRVEDNQYIPDAEGYVGYRELNITYDAPEPGTYRIQIPAFYSLGSNGTVRSVNAANYTLNVAVLPDAVKQSPIPLTLLLSDAITDNEHSHYYREPLIYLLFLPGLIIVLITAIRLSRKAQAGIGLLILALVLLVSATPAIPQLDAPATAYAQGDYQSAIDEFSVLIAEYPNISSLHYNLAICYLALEQVPQAIFEFHQAIALNPHNDTYREALRGTEDVYQLHQQIFVAEFWDPDIFLVALIIIWNISCIISSILLFRKQYAVLVLFVAVAVIASTVSTALFFRSVGMSEQNIAVVGVDESIKRIPANDTQPWFTLQQGLSVIVKGKYENFYHITTATGVEGWIEEASLLYTGSHSD